MLQKIVPLMILSLVVWGCSNNTLDFKMRFAQTEGLEPGDRIMFEKNHIGKVDGVSYSGDGNYFRFSWGVWKRTLVRLCPN
ncbi:MAG: hypothetical protein HQ589_05340 [Syntrophaceae bacterium]|nr:hypothetical protein [Syntrophaceae bacterium]